MLLFKIFGFFDLIAILMMILLQYDAVRWRIAIIFAAYLIIKGIIFKGDFASMMDIVIGTYIILIPIIGWKFFTIIFAIYLGQKAVVSFF
ncbi:MAG: hypothetical protein ABH828_05990 [archaeon]